ncbi:neuropeptide CCHamide-1 receptor-like [Diadema setosum]|uniref:neuropeptide CCHamide-1 receptor-like n=1 Tax=Diadema setosum TaxID=31175 RepID=UPI003B3B2271
MELTSMMMPVLGLSEQANSSFDIYDGYSSSIIIPPSCQKVDHGFARNAIILGIFFFIGFLGNSFLMMVILSNPRLRTSANILLTNLALGDLLYVAASGPFFLEHELSPCWQYGHVACKLVNFTQGVGQGICVYSLTALSIERYSVLVRGGTIRHGGRTRRGVLAACAVWFASCVVATPVLAYAHVEGDDSSPQCFYTRLFSIEAQIYEILKALLMYIVPLVIIACLYTIIAHTLFKSAGAFAGETQPGARHFSARRRLALTVLLLALFFGTLWLPYYVFIVWFQLHPESISQMPGFHAFRYIYYFSSLANSCINPWIIFVMSTSHRKALMFFIRCRKHEQPPTTVACTRTMPNGIPGEKMKQPVDSRSGSRNTRCTEL